MPLKQKVNELLFQVPSVIPLIFIQLLKMPEVLLLETTFAQDSDGLMERLMKKIKIPSMPLQTD